MNKKSCIEYNIFDDGFYNKIPNCMVWLALSLGAMWSGSGRNVPLHNPKARELQRRVGGKLKVFE
jgi:hypothetical protein